MKVFHARIRRSKELQDLAIINSRTPNGEANYAINLHIEANRDLLKSGAKMPRRAKKQA